MALLACGPAPDLGGASPDGGPPADAGAALAREDGGAPADGGAATDGGVVTDAGVERDGGVADGGGASDGGAAAPSELLGAGFTGGACAVDADCGPAGARCVGTVTGGACVAPCTSRCADRASPYAPVTFCIERGAYEERLGGALPFSDPGVCVAKCDFGAFPRSGCRDGLHCERRPRVDGSATDEVCVPGPWTVGLRLSADGGTVLGVSGDGPAAGEPYGALAATRCGGASTADLPAALVAGFARFLLAAGALAGWERLCAAPANLPDRHGTAVEAAAGLAFRVAGARLDVIDWTGLALYGSRLPRRADARGPLWGQRVMVRADDASGTYFVYAGGQVDRPYAATPDRGRHFGVVGSDAWAPLDTALRPDVDYRLVKANDQPAFTRQWGLAATLEWLAVLARAYRDRHGLPVGIGDLSLPTGGPISDHGSHQRGNDADLYLLTFDRGGGAVDGGPPDFARQQLWVSACRSAASGWACGYTENGSGAAEPTVSGHTRAAALLSTLADHALQHAGATWFVQNDVTVLAPFRAMRSQDPIYLDASNITGSGWPVHENHAHVRLFRR